MMDGEDMETFEGGDSAEATEPGEDVMELDYDDGSGDTRNRDLR